MLCYVLVGDDDDDNSDYNSNKISELFGYF
jgi:hypothetical protein